MLPWAEFQAPRVSGPVLTKGCGCCSWWKTDHWRPNMMLVAHAVYRPHRLQPLLLYQLQRQSTLPPAAPCATCTTCLCASQVEYWSNALGWRKLKGSGKDMATYRKPDAQEQKVAGSFAPCPPCKFDGSQRPVSHHAFGVPRALSSAAAC